jgi:hypothetical protein
MCHIPGYACSLLHVVWEQPVNLYTQLRQLVRNVEYLVEEL